MATKMNEIDPSVLFWIILKTMLNKKANNRILHTEWCDLCTFKKHKASPFLGTYTCRGSVQCALEEHHTMACE